MKKIFRLLFGPVKGLPAKRSSPSSRDNPLTIEDGSENATRRQLVQVVLSDVLRRSGIPADWIECQMMPVTSRTRGSGMYVRLVIKHWDDRLMHYAFAFQNELTRDIARFEPNATNWLHGISWQLDVVDSCPYPRLPDKSFWRDTWGKPLNPVQMPAVPSPGVKETPVAARTAATFEATQPFKESGPGEDLERLFAIRDRELAAAAGDGLSPVGYEKTQPSPL